MIRDLPSTSTRAVSRELVRLRNEVGAMAMGRVLTLLVPVDEDLADQAIRVANDATRQHPARILVLVLGNSRGKGRLDAQIRVGGDAGASEIVVLRLYGDLTRQAGSVVTPLLLPDSPIVAWWPGEAPADVAGSALGRIAHRRITDADAGPRPTTQLRRRDRHYAPGDTDLTWTRITRWRALLAASLESAPFEPVESAAVTAEADDPGAALVAGWLAAALGCPVTRVRSAVGTGLVSVRMDRESGPIDLVRTGDGTDTATLTRVGSLPRLVALHTPSPAQTLADELRRLDPDEIYAVALREGLPLVSRGTSRSRAARAGAVPAGPEDVDTSERARVSSAALRRRSPSERTTDEAVQARVEEALEETAGPRVRVFPDKGAVGTAVVDELVARVRTAVTDRGEAHVVLTGGSMGTTVVEGLAARARAGELEPTTWRKVHLWWGDERFVPARHEDRNDAQADDAGLRDLPVPRDKIHRVPTGSDPDRAGEAAARYAADLATYGPDGAGVPLIDVVMLGVGPDAHVASLFPGRPEMDLDDVTTAAVHDSPKPPSTRVTLTLPALSSASAVWLLVAGADKAQAVARARATTDDPAVPASCVRGRQETVWWLDEAAAAGLDERPA